MAPRRMRGHASAAPITGLWRTRAALPRRCPQPSRSMLTHIVHCCSKAACACARDVLFCHAHVPAMHVTLGW